jgi:3-hydroxyisobutyrate dehydrogenase-like beta-hydroxyacid dehydrogenase
MKVAVFGLGIIGEIWARNLCADGDDVRGWNRTPKLYLPFYTGDARSAAAGAELIVIVVADPPAVQAVLDLILPVLHAGQVVVQSSTVTPEAARRFEAQVNGTGAVFLEAPFTGSKPAAEQRKTVYYIGGEPAVLERARPLLGRLSSTIFHIGTVGSASALKLAMNVNIALVGQALCESLTLARAAGISDETYFVALKLNASNSGVAALKELKLRAEDFAPQFSLKHMAKDLRLALEMAEGMSVPETRRVMKIYEEGMARGWGEDDFMCLMRLLPTAESRGVAGEV